MRYWIATKLDTRARVVGKFQYWNQVPRVLYYSYFFMIIYRRAFPKVWSSPSNSKDAAVSLDPGSWKKSSLVDYSSKARISSLTTRIFWGPRCTSEFWTGAASAQAGSGGINGSWIDCRDAMLLRLWLCRMCSQDLLNIEDNRLRKKVWILLVYNVVR